MEKHLLVTVSEQQKAWHGVRFVGNFFSNKSDLKVTLFYLVPRPPKAWEGEGTYEAGFQDDQITQQYEIKGKKALEGAKRQLISSGLRKENIKTKLQVRRFSKELDIIQEGSMGLYDAVVLGHRALSWIEDVFDKSITKQILQEKFNFPIWICRDAVKERKNVLVCVDGSAASYGIADHVGHILGQEEGHEVTLILVNKAGAIADEDPAEIIAKAKKCLTDNGFPESKIKIKIIDKGGVRKTILKEVDEGRFAAVAVGQTGTGSGFLGKVFSGSLCNELVTKLGHSAIWVGN